MDETLAMIAEAHIQQMKLYSPNVLDDFKEGVVNCSEEPFGALFHATAAQKEIIKKIEEKGNVKVWHIIKGNYKFPDEVVQMEPYLLAVDGDDEPLPEWNDGFLARSYSRMPQKGSSDYGDVIIAFNNGGLKRTA